MAEEQSSYVPFRNGQRNSCDRASQAIAFDLEKYSLYIDKIRALFVPSLEYRIHSLLEEFVYSTDSQSIKQFPCFKRFIDAMTMWKGPLNKIAEYDVSMMEEAIRNIVNCTLKDDLITCFLDSIILHHRLSKICRELDALGIEDNILRSLNVWNFVNERKYWASRGFFTNPDTALNCNANPNEMATCHDAERPAEREKVVEPLTTSNVYCTGSTEYVRPLTSDYRARERRQVPLDLDQDLLRQAEGNRNRQMCTITGLQLDDNDEASEFLDERSRAGKAKKIRSISKLKLIVRKVYLEDYGCPTLSRPLITRLPLPCKPSDLISQIFEADPSLTESCLIVMRRKFQLSMRNVCSCLNDILGKLNVEESRLIMRTLYLSCEIRAGYISFKLKTGSSVGLISKCLFVTRIPICQNVHRCAASQDSAASSSNVKLKNEVEEPKCSESYEGNEMDFNDTLVCIGDENEEVDDICCSRLDPDLVEDTAIDTSRDRMETGNAEKISTCFHNKSSEKIMSGVTLRTDDPEKRNEKHCKTLDSHVIDCNKNTKKGRKNILDNPIMKNNKVAQLVNDINCACLSYEDLAETNNEVASVSSNKNLDSLPQTADIDKLDWTYSSSKEFDSESTGCSRADTSSITSFVQNSERDKQLVELNCNRFSNNNVVKVDERSNQVDDLLNSTRAEIEWDSNCACCYDDFIDIKVIDDVSGENTCLTTFWDKLDATQSGDSIRCGITKIPFKDNNSLTISVQTPRLKVSSKGINVDISYPRTIAWLASGDDRSISSIMKTRDTFNGAMDFPPCPLVVARKADVISHNVDKEVFNTSGKGCDFIRPLRRYSVSKRRLRSNADSRHTGVSTEEDPRVGDYSTSLASNTSKMRQGKLQKSHKSKKLHLRYVHATSSNVRSVTSVTTVKYRKTSRKRQNEHSAKMRLQTVFATNQFRKSVDKSVRWIKGLVRTKLAFFNHQRAKATSASRTSRGSDESVEDIDRKTVGRCVRQNSYVTLCSNSGCRGRGCTISHVDSSDVTLSCRRNWGKERSENRMKLRNHRLAGGSEVLSSFSSIDTISPWSYDLLTLAPEDSEAQDLDGGSQQDLGKEETKDKQGLISYNQSSRSRDHGNHEESITISLRSTAMSLADDDSAERSTRKQQKKKSRDGQKRVRNRPSEEVQPQVERRGDEMRKLHEFGNAKDKLSEVAFVRTKIAKDARKRSYGISRSRNARRLLSLGKKQRMLDESTEINCLCRKHVFALLAHTCHDCARDLDLEFESTLSRYVQLCRNVKRSLMRTLWVDDIYEVSTTSMHNSDP